MSRRGYAQRNASGFGYEDQIVANRPWQKLNRFQANGVAFMVVGGTGRVLYTITTPGGSPVVIDAKGDQVPSGSDSAYKVPLGLLQSGVIYNWTARSFDGKYFSPRTTEPTVVATALPQQTDFSPNTNSNVVSAATVVNPWGCLEKALSPHESDFDPGYIKAEAQVNCTVAPQGVIIEQSQSLYRSSWDGWQFIGQNTSYCDSQTYSAGQPFPQCHSLWSSPRMQAYVWWNCLVAGFQGKMYNYLQNVNGYIDQGGTRYTASGSYQTGGWDQPGIIICN